MKTVCADIFASRCLTLLGEMQRTGVPIQITMDGVPVAKVVPVRRDGAGEWRGSMRGSVEIVGDLVRPAVDESEWEALGD